LRNLSQQIKFGIILIGILCLTYSVKSQHQQIFIISAKEVGPTIQLTWYYHDIEEAIFSIQHLHNTKWIEVGTYSSQHTSSDTVNFITSVHSGLNKYRIRLESKISNVFEYNTDISLEPILSSQKVMDTLTFDNSCNYQIFNNCGKLLLEGKGRKIDVSDLPEGLYYLKKDGVQWEFTKIESLD